MIYLLIFLVMGTQDLSQEPGLHEVRNLYAKAAEQQEAGEKLLKLVKPYANQDPLFLGYEAAANMMMAKHVANPFTKMSYFKKGKKMLASAIETDPQNIELRYLRFSIQAETPGFLGYKDHLEKDKNFIRQELSKVKDKELQRTILSYLLVSKAVDERERKEIRNDHNK